jgi:hypothetical protein
LKSRKLQRRNKIGRAHFNKVLPIDKFEIGSGLDGPHRLAGVTVRRDFIVRIERNN